MPTNTNAYNSRVTDESLEKRFRDTFRAQGGSELVDDLYAQGVIVPIVDFTAAATGDVLAQNLQTAWDFTTGLTTLNNNTATLISNAGFWQVDLTATSPNTGGADTTADIFINDGTSSKVVWSFEHDGGIANEYVYLAEGKFVVFLRSGDTLQGTSAASGTILKVWYRQIATVNGDLVNPSGFTSS